MILPRPSHWALRRNTFQPNSIATRRESTFDKLPDSDGWAPEVGFVDGFHVGTDPKTDKAWLAHCYGTVGAGRNNADDSSVGAELYVVIGQSPRQLDDNITVVGRVLRGMELLSTIRRGPPPMGFYENAGRAHTHPVHPAGQRSAGGAAHTAAGSTHRHESVSRCNRVTAQSRR